VKALDRKLIRDLSRLKGQIASIAAVVACGVASVIAMRSTLDSILISRDSYYDSAHFGQVFTSVKRAPESFAARIRNIPGVAVVDTRVVGGALLRVPGLAESAIGHIISVPPRGQPLLNALHIRRGRYISAGANDEVLVNEHFFEANKLRIGDSISAVINGRWNVLRIVGVALSPEFVNDAVPGNTMFVDSRHMGILWMNRDALAPLFDMDGAFNDVTILLAPGGSQDEVIASLDRLLAPYGGGHAYGRKDQPSNNIVTGEIEQLRVFGTAMPIIFLTVAAFLLNIVLSRLIATQREQIAVLKAFGYANRRIAVHFLGYSLVVVLLGAIAGTGLGIWVGRAYTALYYRYFRLPDFVHHTSIGLVASAILISALAAAIGALGGVRNAVRLPPAEGMRPPSPAVFKPLLLERMGLGNLLSPAARMIARNLERRPLRTLSSIIGVAFAAAILVTGLFAFDSVRYMADLQFRVVDREDMTVAFTTPRPSRAGHELRSIKGISRVELFRSTPVRIRSGHHVRQIGIFGLERGAQLRRLADSRGRIYQMPANGLVLSKSLAVILQAKPGDTVTIELLELGGAVREVPIVSVLDEQIGLGGYMEIGALNRLLGEGAVASGAYLSIDSNAAARIESRLAEVPGVIGTTTRAAMLRSFDEQIASSMRLTVTIVISLASVVALGVIYNGVRISLSERARELASLRVLGFTRREVASLLFGEQGVIDLVGTPLGLLLGFGLAFWIITGFASESYRFRVIVSAQTYLLSAGIILVAAVGVALGMRRQIDRLDLVAVLKTGE
jgi:putative ABC transport system permease protein